VVRSLSLAHALQRRDFAPSLVVLCARIGDLRKQNNEP
jgi:hypothetical protein